MEGLAHLVTESLVRHGFETTFDHRRLQWSKWFSCQDRFSLVTAPGKPGLYALGEEVAAPGELPESSSGSSRSEASPGSKRMLALFHISEADDLGMSLGRLFLAPSPQRDRFATGRCFARYVVIEDAAQRQAALSALQRWMSSSAEVISATPQPVETLLATSPADAPAPGSRVKAVEQSSAGFVSGYGFSHTANALSGPALAAASAPSAAAPESSNKQAQFGPPAPIPSGF
jgi:hypothetical protein